MKYVALKRIIDVVLASLALVILAPVLVLVTLLVRVFLGSPVLFKQQRPGYLAQPFYLYKFRSMTVENDLVRQTIPDEKRLTKFGKLLRASSLDELPSLVNVLKGEMSIVGPRPLLMQYVELYSDEQMKRHNAKPGITGLAQVSGRNAITWEDRFALDVKYVDHLSFKMDMYIMMSTVKKVINREGVVDAKHPIVGMQMFVGNHESGRPIESSVLEKESPKQATEAV